MPASETIPEDVMERAALLWQGFVEESSSLWVGDTILDVLADSSAKYDAPAVFSDRICDLISRAILSERARATAAERERCARVAEEQLRVEQLVAARANLVGYAAEFYGGAKHSVPAAIRSGDHNAS